MYRGIRVGQYIPSDSILHNLEARTKIMASIFMLVFIIVASFPYKLLALSLPVIFLLKISQVRFFIYLEALRPFALIILLTVILQVLLVKGTPCYSLGILTITWEGLILAASISIRLVLLLVVIRILTATTTPQQLMAGIEKLLKPFTYIGLPVQELVMIMTISIRFIPLFIEEASRLSLAQQARGIDYGSGSIKQRIRAISSLLIPLLRVAFNRASDIAIAMETRCYNGGIGRTYLYNFAMARVDYIFLAVLLLMGVFVLA